MMPPSDSSQPVFTDHGDSALRAGRKQRVGPVLALLLGFGSSAALIHPALWVLAGVGIAFSTLVLMRQARKPGVSTGHRLAVAGLALSILFATWAPTKFYLHEWHVRQQSEIVGLQWLEFLFRQEAAKAYGAMRPPEDRGNLDAAFEKRTESDAVERKAYEAFSGRPLIRKLIKLNGRARPLFHETQQVITTADADDVRNVYEIRYLTDANNSESFFMRIDLRRTDNPINTSGLWQVLRYSSIPSSSSSKTSTSPGLINPPRRGESP